ncbi:tRNA (adenosine(37)-N6)-threonylcarbamoyltransferase complex ATPase subunit type 1 TsaE [Arthrobacter sp. SA17]
MSAEQGPLPDSGLPADSTQPDSTQPDSTQPGSAQPDSAQPDSAQWEQTFHVETAERTHQLAAAIGLVLEAGDLLVLTGELGAGKTTFYAGIGRGPWCTGRHYFAHLRAGPHPSQPPGGPRPGGPDLVHVDAYRLESASEIDDIDLENTMDSSVTVVEWGRERVEHLSDSRLEVELYRRLGSAGLPGVSYSPESAEQAAVLDFAPEDDDEPRTIVIRGFGPRWARQPSWPGIPEGIS